MIRKKLGHSSDALSGNQTQELISLFDELTLTLQ